jgi:hypothetical protein
MVASAATSAALFIADAHNSDWELALSAFFGLLAVVGLYWMIAALKGWPPFGGPAPAPPAPPPVPPIPPHRRTGIRVTGKGHVRSRGDRFGKDLDDGILIEDEGTADTGGSEYG